MPRKPSIEDDPQIAESLGHVHSPRFVDPNFETALRRLDPLLEPRWNPKRCRWEIYRDGLYILTVQNTKGEYAPLDNRVLQKLFLADTHRYKNKFDFIRHLHLEDEHLMSMKRHEQDEFMRACARDMAPFLIRRKTFNANQQKIKDQERLNQNG